MEIAPVLRKAAGIMLTDRDLWRHISHVLGSGERRFEAIGATTVLAPFSTCLALELSLSADSVRDVLETGSSELARKHAEVQFCNHRALRSMAGCHSDGCRWRTIGSL